MVSELPKTISLIIIFTIISLLVLSLLIKDSWNKQIDKCEQDCKRVGMDFFEYNSGNWGSDSCWCVEDGESVRRVW